MAPLLPLLILLSAHFIADFVLQTDWQAKNKSTNWHALARHVGVYSVVMALSGVALGLPLVPMFVITFVTHFLTDAITSRINSAMWKQQRVHAFFVGVGADQLIHAWALAATWAWLA